MRSTILKFWLFILLLLGGTTQHVYTQEYNYRWIKQGYSMRLRLDNTGVFGYMANPRRGDEVRDSLGLEYPAGSGIEHIFGGGLWVGAKIDTGRIPGVSPRIKVVSTGYEGWAGPLYELFPSPSAADSFWRGDKNRPNEKPAGWDEYWGTGFAYKPISDQDRYCMYTDFYRRPTRHVPLGIKVIQSSYAWDDTYADAITMIEYRIINTTNKSIDSAFVGYFVDADVGPYRISQFERNNFTGYYTNSRTAYIHNPINRGSTPVGVALLSTSRSLDSLRYTFQWYPGPQSPSPDAVRYDLLSAGGVEPDEYPALSDTRFLFGFGPFNIRPATDPHPDTLKVAVAIISGHNLTELQRNASRALDIYLNQGIRLPATPPSPPLRVEVGFRNVKLDWKWRQGDKEKFGRDDPETNWDTTNQVARWDPDRYRSRPGFAIPPGIDSTRGGRNFEAYRVWRSEHPEYPDPSFTLIKQFDVIENVDSARFEYDTGLKYTFTDTNLVRGKTYVYSVTSKSIPNIAYQQLPSGEYVRVPVEPLESRNATNAVRIDLPFAVAKTLGKVSVVPNPYRTDQNYTLESGGYEGLTSKWDERQRRIKFINLPEICTIRVFSLVGDLVKTIEHNGVAGSFPVGDEDMLLVSDSNRALASGIYIFTVESNLGAQTGKFVIIR